MDRYHFREASNSMALKNNLMAKLTQSKTHEFRVLDCKSLSFLCVQLYYKYIAVGSAPLEVNVSSATRARCQQAFQRRNMVNITSATTLKARSRRQGRLSDGVVSLLSSRATLKDRTKAMDFVQHKVSRKKMGIGDGAEQEPFNGDIRFAMSQLLPPLEMVATELTNLLKDSLQRFRKTRGCFKLYQEYDEKKEIRGAVEDRKQRRKHSNSASSRNSATK